MHREGFVAGRVATAGGRALAWLPDVLTATVVASTAGSPTATGAATASVRLHFAPVMVGHLVETEALAAVASSGELTTAESSALTSHYAGFRMQSGESRVTCVRIVLLCSCSGLHPTWVHDAPPQA